MILIFLGSLLAGFTVIVFSSEYMKKFVVVMLGILSFVVTFVSASHMAGSRGLGDYNAIPNDRGAYVFIDGNRTFIATGNKGDGVGFEFRSFKTNKTTIVKDLPAGSQPYITVENDSLRIGDINVVYISPTVAVHVSPELDNYIEREEPSMRDFNSNLEEHFVVKNRLSTQDGSEEVSK